MDQKQSAPRRLARVGRRASSAAIFDAGANRFRCPPGTRRGGTFTDRFGTNCGYRLADSVVDSISKLQAAITNTTRRRGRLLPKRPEQRSRDLPDDYKNNLNNAINALLASSKNLDDVAAQYETRGILGRSIGELSQLSGMSREDRIVLNGDSFFEDVNNLQRLINMPDFENIDDATYNKIVDAIERSMKAEAGRLSLTAGEGRDNRKVQRQIESINGSLLNALSPRRRDTRLATPRDIEAVDETLPDAPPPRLPSLDEAEVPDVVPPPPVGTDFEIVDGTRRYTRRSLNNTQSLRRRKFNLRNRKGELKDRKRKPRKLRALSMHSRDRNELDDRIKQEHTELKNFWIDQLLPERERVDSVGRRIPRNYDESEITEEDILDFLAISADDSDAHRLNMSRYKDFVELSSLVKYIDERNAGLYDDYESRQDFLDAHKPGLPFVRRREELDHYMDHVGRLSTHRKRSIALNPDGTRFRYDIASDFELEADEPEFREPLPSPPPPFNPLADSMLEEPPTPPPPPISFSLNPPSMGDDEKLPRDDGGVPFTPEFERILDLYDEAFRMSPEDRDLFIDVLADETDDVTLLELGQSIDSRELDIILSGGEFGQAGLMERYPEIAKAHVFLEEIKQRKMINKAAVLSDPQGKPWERAEKELLWYIARAESDGFTVEEAIGNLANVQRIPELDKSGIQLLGEAERDFAFRLRLLDNPSEEVTSLSAILTTNTELADIFTGTEIEENVKRLGARSDFGVPFSPALERIYGRIDEIDEEFRNTNASTEKALKELSDDDLVALYVESLNRIEALTSGEDFDIDDVDRSEYLGLLNEFQFIMALEPDERDYARLSEIGGEIQGLVDNFTDADRELLKNKYKFIRSDLGERTDSEVGDVATINLDKAIKRELDARQRKQDQIDIDRLLGIGGGSRQSSPEIGYESFGYEDVFEDPADDFMSTNRAIVEPVADAVNEIPNPVINIEDADADTPPTRNPLAPVIGNIAEGVILDLGGNDAPVEEIERIAAMPDGPEKIQAIRELAEARKLENDSSFNFLLQDAIQFAVDDAEYKINPTEYPRLHAMREKIRSLPSDSPERDRREEIFKSLIRQTILAELASFVDGDADRIQGDGYHNRSTSLREPAESRTAERLAAMIQDIFEFNLPEGEFSEYFPDTDELDVAKAVGRQVLKNYLIEDGKVRDFRTDFDERFGSFSGPAIMSQLRQADGTVLNSSILALDPELLNETRRLLSVGDAPPNSGPEFVSEGISDIGIGAVRRNPIGEGLSLRNAWKDNTTFQDMFEVTWQDAGFTQEEINDLKGKLVGTFLMDTPEDFLLDFLNRYAKDQDSLQKMIDGDFSQLKRDMGDEGFYEVAQVLSRVIDANHRKLGHITERALDNIDRNTGDTLFQRYLNSDGTNFLGERGLLEANPTFTGESRYNNLLTKLGVTLYNTALEGPEQDSSLKRKMGLLLGTPSDTDTPLDAVEQANSDIAEFRNLPSRIDSVTALKVTRAIFGGEKDVYPYENTPDIQPSEIADKLENSDLSLEELDNYINFLIDREQSVSWQDDIARFLTSNTDDEFTSVSNIDTFEKINQKLLAGALLAKYRKESQFSERIQEKLDIGSVPYSQALFESLRPFDLNIEFIDRDGETVNLSEDKRKLLDIILGGQDSVVDRLLSVENVNIDNPTVQSKIKENLNGLDSDQLNSLADALEELFFTNSAGNLLPARVRERGGSAPAQAMLFALVQESDLSFANPEDRQNILNLAYQLEGFDRRALEDPTNTVFSLVMSDGETREIDFSDTTMAALDIGFTSNPPLRDFDIFKRLVNEEIARRTVEETTRDVINTFEQETDDIAEKILTHNRNTENNIRFYGAINRLSEAELLNKLRTIVYAKMTSKELDTMRLNMKSILAEEAIHANSTRYRRLSKISNMLDELALEINENQLIGESGMREIGAPSSSSMAGIGINFGFEHQRNPAMHTLRGLLDAIRYRDDLDDLDDLDPIDTGWSRAIQPETLRSLGAERLGNLISIAEAGNIFDTYMRRMTGQDNENLGLGSIRTHRSLDISGFLSTLTNEEIKEFHSAYERLKGMSSRDLTGVERINRQKMDKAFSEINVDRDIVNNSWLYQTDRYLPLTDALLEIAIPEAGRNLVTRSPYARRVELPEYVSATLAPRSMGDMSLEGLRDAAAKIDRLLYGTELNDDPFIKPATRERLTRQLKNLELEIDRKLAIAALSLGDPELFNSRRRSLIEMEQALRNTPSLLLATVGPEKFGFERGDLPRMKEILLEQLEADGVSDNLLRALQLIEMFEQDRKLPRFKKRGVDGRTIDNYLEAMTIVKLNPIYGVNQRTEPMTARVDSALEAWVEGDLERARNILRPAISEDIAIAIKLRNDQIRGVVGDDPANSPILELLGIDLRTPDESEVKKGLQKMALAYLLEGYEARLSEIIRTRDDVDFPVRFPDEVLGIDSGVIEDDFLDDDMLEAIYARLEVYGITLNDLGIIGDAQFLSSTVFDDSDEIWTLTAGDELELPRSFWNDKANKFIDDLYALEEQFYNGELDGPMAEWFRENLKGERLNLQHIHQLNDEIISLRGSRVSQTPISNSKGYEAVADARNLTDPNTYLFNRNISSFSDALNSELAVRSGRNLEIRNSFAKARARGRVASKAEVPNVWGEESADNARNQLDTATEARVASQAVNIWGGDIERGITPWARPDLTTGITPPRPSISVDPEPSTVDNESIKTFKDNFGLSGIYIPLNKTVEADFGEGLKQYTLVTKPEVYDAGGAKIPASGGYSITIDGEFTHYLVPSDVLEQVNELGAFSPEGQELLNNFAIKGARTPGPALNRGNFKRQITSDGFDSQASHAGFFAGKATFTPVNGDPIVVDARGSGLSRVMNDNAMLFYDALGVDKWTMGARLDGSAAWARAGVITPDDATLDSLDREMNQVADLAIAFFTKRDAGIDTTPDEKHAALITGDISRAKAIKAMANFGPSVNRPQHVDYIRTLDPSGGGKNTAAFVFFSENVFDSAKFKQVIEQNPDIEIENLGTVDDPILDLPLNLTESAVLEYGTRDLTGVNPLSSPDSPLPSDRTASEVSKILSGRQSVTEGPTTGRAFKKDAYGAVVFTGNVNLSTLQDRGQLRTTGPPVAGPNDPLTPADIPSDTPLDKIKQDFLFDFFVLNSSENRGDDSRFFRTGLVSGNNTVLFEDKETGKKYITKYTPVGDGGATFDHPAFGGGENTEENGGTNEAVGAAIANALGFEVGAVISAGDINNIRNAVIIEPLQNIHGPDIVPLNDEFNGGLPPNPTDAQYVELLGSVDPADIVRLLLLDGVINNSDRNAGNVLIKRNPDGTVSLLPIDAGRGVYSRTSRAVDGRIGITHMGPTVPDESKIIRIEEDGREQLKKIIVAHLMDTLQTTPTFRMMGLAKVLGKDSVRGKDTSEIKIDKSKLNSVVDNILSQVAQLGNTIDDNSILDIERNFGTIERQTGLFGDIGDAILDVRRAFQERRRWLQQATREDIIKLLEEAYETIQAPFEVDNNE